MINYTRVYGGTGRVRLNVIALNAIKFASHAFIAEYVKWKSRHKVLYGRVEPSKKSDLKCPQTTFDSGGHYPASIHAPPFSTFIYFHPVTLYRERRKRGGGSKKLSPLADAKLHQENNDVQ